MSELVIQPVQPFDNEGRIIPLSVINQYLYCPRRAALIHVEGTFAEKVGKTDWAVLRERLLKEIDSEHDSLRIYHLDKDIGKETEHHGISKPVDLSSPLVF